MSIGTAMPGTSRTSDILRTARERRGISIEQAASQAGIPLRYVRLLEGETLEVGVADELYLVPFLRRYAAALELDPTELLPDFLGHVQHVPADAGAPPRLLYRSRLTGLWKPAAVLVAIAAAAGVMARRVPPDTMLDDEASQLSDETHEQEVSAAAPQLPSPQPEPRDSPATERVVADNEAAPTIIDDHAAAVDEHPATADQQAPAVIVGAAPTALPSTPMATAADTTSLRELRVVANEDTWLAIVVDDQPSHEVLMHPGESRSWTARNGFTLTLGNAGGVVVSLDGRDMPLLGRSGQVVRNIRLPEPAVPPSGG